MTAQPISDANLLVHGARRQVVRFAGGLIAVNLLLPFGFLIYALVSGEDFNELFWYETDAISWFSSVQLLLVSFAAYLNHQAEDLLQRLGRGHSRRRWIWLVFAAGFLALALDERFELHEALRDEVLEPGGLFVGIPFVRAGDVGLYFYLAAGLVFAWILLRDLRRQPRAWPLFLGALTLSACIVVVDSLDDPVIERLPLAEFWDSSFEEIAEIWAQLLFLLSFLVALHDRLGRIPKASPD